MPLPADYRQRIRTVRRTMGLKQPDFAALVGVSPITISRWENGQNAPTDMAWARIEELVNRSAEPLGTLIDGLAKNPQFDFGADPEAVAAVAEAARLSYGHLASPTSGSRFTIEC